jgi:hypothetical protein
LLASEKMEERRNCVLAQCRVGLSRDSLASRRRNSRLMTDGVLTSRGYEMFFFFWKVLLFSAVATEITNY